jgi:hypothetical protein
MRRRLDVWLAVALGLVSWALSMMVHYPGLDWTIYSDIIGFWHREEGLRQGVAACINYFLEYPPASCTIITVARMLGGPSEEGYYIAYGLLSLPAYILLAISIVRLYPEYRSDAYLMPASPSLIVYGIYNFDHFVAAFIAFSLYLHLKGRTFLSTFSLGVAIAFKAIPIILAPLYFSGGGVRRKTLGLLLGLAPFTYTILLNPHYPVDFLQFHAGWGLENAWYLWLVGDPFSPSAKVFGVWLGVILLMRAYLSSMGFLQRSFLVLSSWMLSSYVFTPQMALWLLPLIPAGRKLILLWPPFEAANILLIFTWFTTPTPTLPWTLPQAMALARAVVLAAMYGLAYGWNRITRLSAVGRSGV